MIRSFVKIVSVVLISGDLDHDRVIKCVIKRDRQKSEKKKQKRKERKRKN